MALVWLEGFEKEGDPSWLVRKYEGQHSDQITVASGQGRAFGNAGTGAANFTIDAFTPQLSASNTWVIGLGVKRRSATTFPDARLALFSGGPGTPGTGTRQLELIFGVSHGTDDIIMSVFNGTTTWNITKRLVSGQWYYLEFEIVVGAMGSWSLYIDGVLEQTQAGVNTDPVASGTGDCIRFGMGRVDWDDVYVVNGVAGGPTARLGNLIVEGLDPNADSAAELQWDSTGANHFGQIQDALNVATPGTSRVTADATGLRDLYGYNATQGAAATTVHGMQVNSYVAMDGSGSRSFKHRFRDVGGSATNGNTWAVSGTVVDHTYQIWFQNPVTASPLTGSIIQSMEVGQETV